MIGNSFLLTTPQGQVLSTGTITEQVGPGTYMARFRGKVPMSRVVNTEQMTNWLMFDNENHMAAWMAENVASEPKPDKKAPPKPAAFAPAIGSSKSTDSRSSR